MRRMMYTFEEILSFLSAALHVFHSLLDMDTLLLSLGLNTHACMHACMHPCKLTLITGWWSHRADDHYTNMPCDELLMTRLNQNHLAMQTSLKQRHVHQSDTKSLIKFIWRLEILWRLRPGNLVTVSVLSAICTSNLISHWLGALEFIICRCG